MPEPYIGEIRLFAGNFLPMGRDSHGNPTKIWAFCDGSPLSIADNQMLFSLIGTTYGGDGHNTFNLPDLRGRLVVGQGTGSGLSPRPLAQSFGNASVSLQLSQIPEHNHSIVATTQPADTASPIDAVLAQSTGQIGPDPNDTLLAFIPPGADGDPVVSLAEAAVSSAGSAISHNNLMPGIGINYIMALAGIFPDRP